MRVARNEFVMVKTENFSTMKQTMKQLTIVTVCVLMLGQVDLASGADANPPEWMTYQGYLVDGNGDSLGSVVDPSDSTQRVSSPANYVVIFRVYSAKQGGTALWAEQQTVTVSNGYFSVLLGQGSQYGSELNGDLSAVFDGADASDRFIGITVDIGGVATEIAPRLRLVTSPYAYTARQARRLTDGSGNSNFDKVGTSLELGAGSTPTLTLPEAGGASLVGKLTADLPSWGTGLQIDNGALTTTIGAQNSGLFHFNTGLPQFYFNKNITVAGNIRSYNTDTILGPSNNTDTYLQVYDDTSDKIEARADQFVVQGDSKYLMVKFTSTAAELRSDASKFYINRPLDVNGALSADSVSVDGGLSADSVSVDGGLTVSYINKNGGKVGVGTDSPSTMLHLNATTDAELEVIKTYINVLGTDVLMSSIPVDSGAYGVLMIGSRGGGHLRIDGNEIMAASNNTPTTLYLNANGGTVKVGSATVTSDQRLKHNIHPIKYGLSELRALKPVSYDWRLDLYNLPGTQLGFIAQDVQKVLPELVTVEADSEESRFKDELALNVNGILPVVVASVQELDKENRQLKSEVETLKSEMTVLKARLASSTTQEDRIAKLEELVRKIGQGE